jgi:hypothetical protein
MNELFSKGIEFKEVVAFLAASAAGIFALWRWTIEQR